MAERIEGLSIGLGLDTLGIDKGMSELKRKLAGVNSEMKANMSAFDKSEVSVKKYETKLAGLNKRLDLQKVAVQNAKDEYEKMVKIHGEGSTQADKAAGIYNKEAASLNNLNRYVEGVTEEFKAFQKEQEIAGSGLGKLSKSLESVGASFTKVGDKMKNTGKGLTVGITAPIVAFGAAGVVAFNEVDDAIDTVITKTGATGDAADVLTENFRTVAKRVPDDLLSVGEAIGEVNTQFGFMGKELEDNSQLMLEFAKINGTDVTSSSIASKQAIEAYGLANSDLGSVLDAVTKTAQDTGQSVDDLFTKATEGAPQIKALGLNFADGTALIGGFEKAGVDSSAALTSLSKAQVIFAKDGKTLEEGLNGTIDSILNAKSETEALTIASEVFGTKGGPRMVDAIQRGTFNLEDFAGAGEKAAGAVKDTFNETVDPIDQAAIAMNNSKLAMGEVGEVLQIAALPFMKKATEVMGILADKMRAMSPAAKQTSLVIGAIAAAIGPVLVAVGSMISIFGGAMTTLAPFLLKVKEAGGWFKYLRVAVAALTGPVGLTIAVIAALTAGFIPLYRNSETFRTGVQALIQRVKELATTGLTMIKPAIAAVTGFFKNQLTTIQNFWSENSVVILSALSNIGKVTASIMKGIMAVIQFVMPAVLVIIRSVWGNIKGVINGALNVIMGAVKIFSGLFTGDFSKMWEGIKQVFFGAIRLVWNAVQLTFFGRIAKGAALFIGSFRAVFAKLWQYLIGLFTRSVSSVFSTVSRYFNLVLTTTRSIFNAFSTFLRNIFTAVRDSVTRTAGNIFTNVRGAWTKLKDSTSEIFRGIYNGIKGRFTDIVNAAKNLPKRIGDGIGSMASKVKGGVTKVINNLATTLGKGVNGVISGINWVLDKIGVGKAGKIDLWPVPQYANGTHGHPGGPAIVGDGRGLNAGRELIQTPSGELGLSPAVDTMVNLPKGTQVLSAKKTRELLGEIPRYENGTGGLWEGIKKFGSAAWEGTKNAGSAIKDAAFNVWDHVSNPGKLLDTALSLLGIKKPDGGSLVGDMARGAFDKVKTGALGFLKNSIDESGTMAGSGHGFGSAFTLTSRRGFRINPVTGIGQMHQGDDWGARAGTLIPAQAAGKVIQAGFHAIRGNFVRVQSGIMDRLYQHNQRNLVSVGQAVKKGQAVGTVGSTGRSTGPHLHYEVRRNGVNIDPAGLETGGITNRDQLVRISEKNREEITIPMHKSRRTDAMKLMAIAGKKLMSGGKSGGGITRPNQLPNVPAGGGNEDQGILKSLLAATLKQNEILMQLLQKNGDVYMDNGALVGAIGNDVNTHLGNSSKNSLYMSGMR